MDNVRFHHSTIIKDLVNKTNNKHRVIKKSPKGLNTNSILMTFEFSNGEIGIATGDEGLNIYNPKTNVFRYMKNNPDNETFADKIYLI